MKYIRTKDERILKAPNIYDNGAVVLASDPPQYETRNSKDEWGCVFCHDEIKQADTIEELCDKFVLKGTDIDSNKNAYTTLDFCPNKNQLMIHPKHKIEVFGAIWTFDDDGSRMLKYVAKMNDEGELELL